MNSDDVKPGLLLDDCHLSAEQKLTRELKRINDEHAGDLSRFAKQGWFCYGLIVGLGAMFLLQGVVEVLRG